MSKLYTINSSIANSSSSVVVTYPSLKRVYVSWVCAVGEVTATHCSTNKTNPVCPIAPIAKYNISSVLTVIGYSDGAMTD